VRPAHHNNRWRHCVSNAIFLFLELHLPPNTHTFSLMAKAQDARKEKKKEPTKSLKEKKAEKEEKKVARARKQE
jgi:hypothetical protein